MLQSESSTVHDVVTPKLALQSESYTVHVIVGRDLPILICTD